MSDHPKVYYGPDGDWITVDDEWIESATHKVVPLDALVIERDDNGEWPEWVWEAWWPLPDGPAPDNFLNALEAAQKEKP